jgi:hypothetical protein
LLFTALNNQFWSLNLNAPMASLPAVIFQFALSPYKEWQQLAWTGALIITLAVLGLSIIARALLSKGNLNIPNICHQGKGDSPLSPTNVRAVPRQSSGNLAGGYRAVASGPQIARVEPKAEAKSGLCNELTPSLRRKPIPSRRQKPKASRPPKPIRCVSLTPRLPLRRTLKPNCLLTQNLPAGLLMINVSMS